LGKQAHATQPGLELLQVAQRIFAECELVDAAMRRFRKGWVGRVRVGTTLTAMIYRLPPILRRLRLDHPGLELVVTNMPTQDSVASIIENTIDLALVTLPVEKRQARITPLLSEMLVAIFAARTRDVPDEITPDYVARQPFLIEHMRSAAHPLVMGWLSGQTLQREPTPIGTVEALKTAVASRLGMAIVPEVAVAKHRSDFVVRPLQPSLSRTLALIEHRNKPNDQAIEIVRNALLTLQSNGTIEVKAVRRKQRN
jgi:DNA-binding transcriptional LysR family regulator